MNADVDIFKSDRRGVLWVGVASDLESAKAHIQALGKSQPGEYLIMDQRTGDKIAVSTSDSPKDICSGLRKGDLGQ